MNKTLIVPSGEVGDKIIQVYKDAGYKIKKPKPNKVKIKQTKGILEDIKHPFHYEPPIWDYKAR